MSTNEKIKLKDKEYIIEIIQTSSLKFFWHYLLSFLIIFSLSFFAFWLIYQGLYGIFVFTSSFLAFFSLLLSIFFKKRKNYWILTNQRLVDVERTGIFSKNIHYIEYENIIKTHIRKKGFLSRIFRLGDILIEIKDEDYLISLSSIKHPQILAEWISKLVESLKEQNEKNQQNILISSFKEIIPILDKTEVKEILNRLSNRLNFINKQSN